MTRLLTICSALSTLQALGCGSPAKDQADAGAEGADAASQADAYVAPQCDSPAERVKWSYLTRGPDHIRKIVAMDDADGDTLADIAVATDHVNMSIEGMEKNYVLALSSASGQEIWASGPAPAEDRRSSGWGHTCMNNMPDVNGDGMDELVFAGAWSNRSAHVVDGKSGETLWSKDTKVEDPDGEGGWVYDIDSYSDITGDGVAEVLWAGASDPRPKVNVVYLSDGKTGDILWRYRAKGTIFQVEAIPDVNGDGFGDAVHATSDSSPDGENAVLVTSGAPTVGEPELLWRYHTGGTNWTMTIVDSDGGDDDVGVSSKDPDVVIGDWAGVVTRLDGETGQMMWAASVDTTTIAMVVRLDDVNGDDFDEIAVTTYLPGTIAVLDGKTGSELWRGQETEATWGLSRVDDLDRDGINDVVSASADTMIRAYSGATGQLLWDFKTGDERAMAVASVSDVTGDGVADIVAGTQYRNVGEGGGTVYLLEGCP